MRCLNVLQNIHQGKYWALTGQVMTQQAKQYPKTIGKKKVSLKYYNKNYPQTALFKKDYPYLNIIKEEKNKLALNASLLELNDGRYDLINHIYYEQLEILFYKTAFEPLSDFYKERDELIAQNILEIIKKNTGKRMIFLMGADHRDYALKKVSETFGKTILLNHLK